MRICEMYEEMCNDIQRGVMRCVVSPVSLSPFS